MKSTLCLSTLLFVLVSVLSGQVPQTISYQGVLTDANGKTVEDGNYNLTFKLYEVASGGTSIWSEEQVAAISTGIFNVSLGSTTPLNRPFDKPYWLGITVGTGTELSPSVKHFIWLSFDAKASKLFHQ